MTNSEDIKDDFERKSTRNFIKENVNNIKQIQGIIQMQKGTKQKFIKSDKFRSVPTWQSTKNTPEKCQKQRQITKATEPNKCNKKSEVALWAKSEIKKNDIKSEIIPDTISKFSHRSVQTERTDDPVALYETGVIKYSSLKPKFSTKVEKTYAEGDNQEFDDNRERDYIRENILNLKPKPVRQITPKVPADVPPTYQKGRLPKYLQAKKEEVKEEEDICPIGHVLLPESERKETLKVLRENYADRIQQLNALPVRSDTLRVKKRKQDIEEELRKLDSGIKVFQRPKVFVKINS